MKYVLITGGELGNKGAQAMTFITVSEVRERYPEHKVIVVSYNDYPLPPEEKSKYKFTIATPCSMVYPLYRLGGLFKLVSVLGRHSNDEQLRLDALYGNADLSIDISGYALGSNWGAEYCLNYLNNILIAKVYGIRCILMPQSFGPFDFKRVKGRFVEWLMKKLLRYPELIYAREQEGFDLLTKKYGLENVSLSCDLVLNNTGINPATIFVNPPALDIPSIEERSIGVIPNRQNFKYGNRDEVLEVYVAIIKRMLASGRLVYLLRHSFEDLEICHEIKQHFETNDAVSVLDGDYSCFEFNSVVGKFDFLVASRFHSVVHAFKEAVPCVVLGWAVKYHELAALFDQSQYVFDVREGLDTDGIVRAVETMAASCGKESEKIRASLSSLQEKNVYDVISA